MNKEKIYVVEETKLYPREQFESKDEADSEAWILNKIYPNNSYKVIEKKSEAVKYKDNDVWRVGNLIMPKLRNLTIKNVDIFNPIPFNKTKRTAILYMPDENIKKHLNGKINSDFFWIMSKCLKRMFAMRYSDVSLNHRWVIDKNAKKPYFDIVMEKTKVQSQYSQKTERGEK